MKYGAVILLFAGTLLYGLLNSIYTHKELDLVKCQFYGYTDVVLMWNPADCLCSKRLKDGTVVTIKVSKVHLYKIVAPFHDTRTKKKSIKREVLPTE